MTDQADIERHAGPRAAAPPPDGAAATVEAEDAGHAAALTDADRAARAEEERAAAEQAEREAQLQRLLQRMQTHADFPSLKDSIRGIQKVARSESAHLRALTDEVLGDPALSNKLLRMINTAFYSAAGGGNITSLQRAVALMGFQPVGMLATSLTLFEKLPKGPDGARVKQAFSRGLMAAMLANQLCPVRRLEESAYVVALFQNLGTMLAWMHFPTEAMKVELLLHQRGAIDDHEALQVASREVLGMGYDDLALEVARLWGWPEALQVQLRPLEPEDPERAVEGESYLRVVCTAANRLAAELETVDDGPEALEALVSSFETRYGVPLGLTADDMPAVIERAQAQWADLALVLGFAQAPAAASRGRAKDEARPTPRSLSQALPRRKPMAIALGGAVDDVARLVEARAPMGELLQLVMDRLLDTLELQRVLICLREGGPGGDLVGRLGLGERAAQLAPVFRVPMRPPGDLFGLLCAKGADTLISDTSDPLIARRLPLWYRRRIDAPTFLLLPLTSGNQALGMIYGDRAAVRSLVIGDAELALLKSLRDQLMAALRARGVAG